MKETKHYEQYLKSEMEVVKKEMTPLRKEGRREGGQVERKGKGRQEARNEE